MFLPVIFIVISVFPLLHPSWLSSDYRFKHKKNVIQIIILLGFFMMKNECDLTQELLRFIVKLLVIG